jgi:hypothetical protein
MGIKKEIPSVSVGASDVVLYARTPGRVFKLTELVVTNPSTGTARIQIFDGPSTENRLKLDVELGGEETVELDGKHRVFGYGDVVAKVVAGGTIVVSGSGEEE